MKRLWGNGLRLLFFFTVVIISVICLVSEHSLLLFAEQQPAEPSKKNEGEKAPQPGEVKPDEPKEVPEKVIPPKVTRKTSPGDVSFFFDDADVYEVIQTVFGEILKVNYIVDPKVKGRVNFRTTTPISRADVLPVIEIILRLNGVAVVEERGLYRIISIGDVPREPAPIRFGRDPEAVELKGIATVQVVQLKYIGSTEIVKILTPLVSQGGTIFDIPPQFIIIADTDANTKRLLQVVEIFDSEKLRMTRPQVYVYPVQNSKAKDVANLLQQIFLGVKPAAPAPAKPVTPTTPAPVTAPPGAEAIVSEVTRIFADEVTNSVIILATPEDFATIAEAIKKIDIVPRQVVIEGLVAEVQLRDELSMGIAWSLRFTNWRPFGDGRLRGSIAQDAGTLTRVNPAALTAPGFSFVATDPAGVVRGYITALVQKSRAELLAAPHILVSDNREARIQVGQQVPIVTSETLPAPGYPSQRTIQYKDIGIILKVKPQVNEGGLVSMDITQEVSSYTKETLYVKSQEIILNKTEATTNLVVQDGQTIIIGGLIREDIMRSRAGIPILSSIPILGYLFGSTSRETMKTELIILLTPHVIKTQQDAKSVTSDYIDRFTDATKKLKKEELLKPGKERDSSSEPPPSP
ncbi:MAG: hypothetical protein FJ243_01415 [Nitrospira sp.]|nr:hypothetical protein [Nitrospira sp.]